MYFTQEQIREIQERLSIGGSKDKSLPLAQLPLKGDETLALVQQGENRKVAIDEFYEEFSQYIDSSERVDFFNVSRYVQRITGNATSVQLTLDEAVQACPPDVRRGGQMITFVDNDGNWTMWQYTGVTPDNWENTDVYWDNLESDPNLGIRLITTITNIPFGTTADFTVHFETVDGGKARTVELYINDILFQTYHDISEFNLAQTGVRTNMAYKVRVVQYGKLYQKEANVIVTYPAWVGAGIDETAVMVDANKIDVSTEINGAFDVEFSDTGYLIVIIPDFIVLKPITMNGFEVPMQPASVMVIDGINYRSYRSANQYVEGTHRFIIGTYEGGEQELIQSMQQDIAGLQNLVEGQEETNNSQTHEITTMQDRIAALEENTYNEVDNEDLTVVNHKYKFADKAYSQSNFTGKGRVFLRKNIRQIEEQIDENTVITRTVNLLTSAMITSTDTLFHVQYDYTLHDGRIVIPARSGIVWEGGSFSDGILDISGAILPYGWENIIGSHLTIAGVPAAGTCWFNTSLGQPIWSNGTEWVDADGNSVTLS